MNQQLLHKRQTMDPITELTKDIKEFKHKNKQM